jgi:hypothetical protein
MTDYRDGKWHGWNGGGCPVNPDDVIVATFERSETFYGEAKTLKWDYEDNAMYHIPVAFRVVKRAPLVLWINEYPDGILGCHSSKEIADRVATPDRSRCFKVQEVED